MQGISRIVEISSPSFLSFKDRALHVERDGEEVGRVPLEDLGILVIDGYGIAMMHQLLAACAEENVAVVICDSKHVPCGVLAPLESNSLHAKTLREQIAVQSSTKKRLWQTIVMAKIREQSRLLQDLTRGDDGIGAMAELVRSGDPNNMEGQAARRYYLRLFGEGFVRNREGGGINAMLNYGYAVLRGAVARAVVSTGLHPALGIHHKNQYNAFALADDLLEPLRPIVDEHVWRHVKEQGEAGELLPAVKRSLLTVLTREVFWCGKRYPILTAIGHYAANFRDSLLGGKKALRCPTR